MKRKIGLISIGQSPREDITKVLIKNLHHNVELIELGALDGLTNGEIKQLKPTEKNNTLVTRLSNGEFVYVDKKKITKLLQKQINKMEEMNVRCIVLGCTGKFPELKSTIPFLVPEQTFRKVVDSIINKGRIGIIMPTEDQKERGIQKWSNEYRELFFAFSSPYQPAEALEKAAIFLCEQEVDIIILDCMGFSEEHFQMVREVSQKTTLYPADLMGKVSSWLVN